MAFEVIRIIRYEYEDADRMVEDMKHWTVNGTYGRMSITSAHLPPTITMQVETVTIEMDTSKFEEAIKPTLHVVEPPCSHTNQDTDVEGTFCVDCGEVIP
jgi:hypothetical protein